MADKNSIITLPHQDLRQRSRKVKIVTEEVKQLVEDMKAATLDWESTRGHELGVALAAVQIDKLERVVVIRNDFENKDDRTFLVLINPEIIKCEGQPEKEPEGCLSVKDVYGQVPRYPKVRVRAMNLDGHEVRIKAEGFLARILQHEIDHTNGVLFIDHIDSSDDFSKLNDKGQLEPMPEAETKRLNIFDDEK